MVLLIQCKNVFNTNNYRLQMAIDNEEEIKQIENIIFRRSLERLRDLIDKIIIKNY